MDRRRFITMMGGSILAAPLAGKAQQTGKVYRIGFLWPSDASSSSPYRGAFDDGMRRLEHQEG